MHSGSYSKISSLAQLHDIVKFEHVYSSRKYLDIAFSGFIGSLEKKGDDIRNKYGVGKFISGVHFALRSRTLFTLFYGLILGLKISQPDLRKSAKLSIVRIYFISYK